MKKVKYVKVTPEEIDLHFKTKSGKKVIFKAVKPKAEVKTENKERSE